MRLEELKVWPWLVACTGTASAHKPVISKDCTQTRLKVAEHVSLKTFISLMDPQTRADQVIKKNPAASLYLFFKTWVMCQTVEQNTAQGHGWILERINFKALKSHQHLAKFSFRFNKEQSSDFRTNNSQFIQTRTVEPVEPPKPLTFVLWRQWQTSHSCHCSSLTSFVIPYKWLLFFIFFKSTRYQVQN